MKVSALISVIFLSGVLLLGACESNTRPGANEDPDYPISMGGP